MPKLNSAGQTTSSTDAAVSASAPLTKQSQQKTFWYTIADIADAATCPSCGVSLERIKKPMAHVKKCFSIKRIGPIYRLHGYYECKCGLLIADSNKAKKLHICSGEVPAFEPDLDFLKKEPPSHTIRQSEPLKVKKPNVRVKALERELLQPKPWIRNFVSPLKMDGVTVTAKPKPKPRVRNFDMARNMPLSQDTWVYSIRNENGDPELPDYGLRLQSTDEKVILIRKKFLSLPKSYNGTPST